MAAYGNLQPVICNEQERRCAVIQILCIKGNTISNTQVSELIGIDRRRVAELRQQLKDTKDPRAVVDRAFRPSSSARKARTPDFIRRVSDIFEHDPSRSIRDVAKKLDVSHVTLLACVNEDLRCHSYKLKVGQLLTQKNKNMRLYKSVKLLNKHKYPKENDMLWSIFDDNFFCQDQKLNKQNQRWVANCAKGDEDE
ncbi:Uncharacterized protein FKW44_002897, partial [Caligus rogercresseyi]